MFGDLGATKELTRTDMRHAGEENRMCKRDPLTGTVISFAYAVPHGHTGVWHPKFLLHSPDVAKDGKVTSHGSRLSDA